MIVAVGERSVARKDLAPSVEATGATQGELPAYARGRLQTKVRQTLGRPAAKANDSAEPASGLLLRWRWWLGLALAAAAAAFLVIPAFLGQSKPVMEVALLDLAGATRGADDESVSLFQGPATARAARGRNAQDPRRVDRGS